ncbi:MAG TPA: hypothetical protein VF292_08745 [Rhodanobacteraceae bacterium]
MYQNDVDPTADPLRAEIWRALVEQFHGVAPVAAGDAFEAVTRRRIKPTALTRRRNKDRLPWPRGAEIRDGRRLLVPLHVLVDCILQKSAGAPRHATRRRGRPPLTTPARGVEVP